MIASGWMFVGALFCLLGTVALVAVAFIGLRWFADHGRGPEAPVPSGRGPAAERLD